MQNANEIHHASRLLIPSIKYTEISNLRKLSKYFKEIELDLYGIKHSKSRNAPPGTETPEDIAKNQKTLFSIARALVKNAGMVIYSVHLRGFDLSYDNTARMEQFIGLCDRVNSILAPKVAVLHTGYGDLPTLLSNLEYALEKIPREVVLVIENMTKRKAVLNSPRIIGEFVEKIADYPPNLGICVDTTHPSFSSSPMNAETYTNLVVKYMEAAGQRLRHLHFSDRLKKGSKSRKHLPIGHGMIDWKMLNDFLTANKYDGRAVIEIRFADEIAEEIIYSAEHFYGCAREDLEVQNGEEYMPEMEKIAIDYFLEKVGGLLNLPKVPSSLQKILNLPNEAIIEESEDFLYYVIPSSSYSKDHADPFEVMRGETLDKVKWADYVFGVRYHKVYLSALVIDKERRIAVEWVVLSAYDRFENPWEGFENAVKEAVDHIALMEERKPLSERPEFDHLHNSVDAVLHYVEKDDDISWE